MMRLVCLALLLLVGPATAQADLVIPEGPAETTLFFHLDAYQDFPINTQPPHDGFERGTSRGITASTTTCTPPDSPGQAHQAHHTTYGFSTPGYVEYDITEDGGPRIHPERGLAYDVELDRSAGMTGHWYLKTSVEPELAPPEVSQLPVLVPQVVVEFTMRTGDEVGFGAEAYNAGQTIAHGRSTPVNLVASAENPNYRPQADGSHVYEFEIPMDVVVDSIPADEDTGGYNIRVDTYMDVPGCDEDSTVMPGSVEIYTAPDHRPRLDLTVENPVRIDYIHPQFIGADLLIHASLNSPWGNYDVDETEGGITVIIDGSPASKSIQRVAFEQEFHEHGFHFEPVQATYQWDYDRDQAEGTQYQVTIIAFNDQRTAAAASTAFINLDSRTTIDTEGNVVEAQEVDKDTPALPVVVLLIGLGLAARIHARR